MSKSDAFNNLPPLQRFGMARKEVNQIYRNIAKFVNDGSAFLQEFDQHSKNFNISVEEIMLQLKSFANQVAGIQEMLTRDQMKVCFFGRTSNGKSTVVNAMLEDKILPTGMGHTSNCFCSVSGCDGDESYMLTPNDEKLAVTSVKQLASALSQEKLESNALVRVYWPKNSCLCSDDFLLLIYSPGIDVTPDLDSWINQHCLDADVFVLVANAESTLMITEKNFFHKVSERLSKPNIFILNNRWDASANEPDIVEEVKKQHLERTIDFLANELQVANKRVALDRVFFVSAKELLSKNNSIMKGVGFSEGYQARLLEFESFEKKFKECISESAIKTKFEQHAKQGLKIIDCMKDALQQLENNIISKIVQLRDERSTCLKNLAYVKNRLRDEASHFDARLKQLTSSVEKKVAKAMTREINHLAYLVDDFNRPFHSHDLVIQTYKKELLDYIDEGLGRNLMVRCSETVNDGWNKTRNDIIKRIREILPADYHKALALDDTLPEVPISYNLDCHNLCGGFQEDIKFRFTWGWRPLLRSALVLCGNTRFVRVLDENEVISTEFSQRANQDTTVVGSPELPISLATGIAMASSYSSLGIVITAGAIFRMVGWRLFTVGIAVYGGLYGFERLTWTRGAQERTYKKQFVNYATQKLKMMISITSRNCSNQIQNELNGTYHRLINAVTEYKTTLEEQSKELNLRVSKLEEIENTFKVLR
ncbi:uncharacterized protein TRIADDRAFT_26969 [Trichoplax adhaerens]|uniref:Dynamin-type G domain-containing protein n=1 Tax=Trichoplax adhaerens TaxID=10228 RepID=B3RZD3_TRIAD|nr:hypothetical protein TRIADDRAFT_26969 [Trichoplax adhaerens]EDV23825.1 hypothetical protein TRIADDRAFT_26969 [Trichoplax adhaerens]|eukprot:XP_002113351.1 hypothetical protein TRIADDRAFT_26969 [Trichoplax adhaerens]